MTRWLLLPARSWRRVTGRTRRYALGLAVSAAAEIGALSGAPHPVALAVFAAGLLLAATAIRPDRGKP